MGILSTAGMKLAYTMATDPFQAASGDMALGALETTAIPVDLPSSTYETLYRLVLGGVQPGDLLDITANARVTNNCGYNIGVGWHLWVYDYTDPARSSGTWYRVSHFMGENVTPDMHHMPLTINALVRMPSTWVAGHRPVVVLRADAHSTAWQEGDTLDVDAGYGQLRAGVYTAA